MTTTSSIKQTFESFRIETSTYFWRVWAKFPYMPTYLQAQKLDTKTYKMKKSAMQTNPAVTWSGVVQWSAVGRWSAEVSALVFIWPVLAAAAVGPGYWEHFSNHGQKVLGCGYCRQHQNNLGQQKNRQEIMPPCQNWLQLIWLTDMNPVLYCI